MVKGIIISDTHSGHLLGLTPPQFRTSRPEIDDIMAPFWDWWMSSLNLDGYDVMIHCGDIVDGDGHKDTSFHLTTDINQQVAISKAVIDSVNARKHLFVYGTPYHGGDILDYEKIVADSYGGKISWRQQVDIEGVRFSISHVIGKTTTPVGGDIALRKKMVWDALYSVKDTGEAADVILCGHAHEYRLVADDQVTACICPALKIGDANFDRYGRKMQGGHYHVGFIEFVVDNGRLVEFSPKIYRVNVKREYERI